MINILKRQVLWQFHYASADYFIYASVSETFGQVYLEAMASGTPVIAAEGGQLKEFFINSEHGYLWQSVLTMLS